MAQGTHTHWGMTINNYDDTDLALLAQGYPDHIRQLVYTRERGKEGTPHIQAFIKMKRDCRLSHMKKLFPRGNFKFIDSSEYRLHAQRYAQKLDHTAEGPATITNGDPIHTVEGMVRRVCLRMLERFPTSIDSLEELIVRREDVEQELVLEDYTVARVFVGATYRAMWDQFGYTMYRGIRRNHTHTHTHKEEESSVDIDTDDGRTELLRQEGTSQENGDQGTH